MLLWGIVMNDRHRQIIEYWNGGKWGGHTLQETGDKFGITRERVRSIVSKYGLKRNLKPPTEPKPPRVAKHGTRNEYQYWGCRCEICNKANTDYVRHFLANKI